MKKRFLLSLSLILALVVLGVSSYAATEPALQTHQYRCEDRNQSLYFVVYENNGKLVNGHMYVENMQVATLTVEQAGTDVIKAKVNGNTANVAFQLLKLRSEG